MLPLSSLINVCVCVCISLLLSIFVDSFLSLIQWFFFCTLCARAWGWLSVSLFSVYFCSLSLFKSLPVSSLYVPVSLLLCPHLSLSLSLCLFSLSLSISASISLCFISLSLSFTSCPSSATTSQHMWAKGLSPFPPVSSPLAAAHGFPILASPARPSWALGEGAREEGRAAWRAHPFLPFQAGRLGQWAF